MNKRFLLDLTLIAAMAVIPRLFGVGFEANRLAVLAGAYAAVALLGVTHVLRGSARRAADLAFGAVLLVTGWFVSFAAWNHSAEIGLYIAFGAVLLASGFAAPRGMLLANSGGHEQAQ